MILLVILHSVAISVYLFEWLRDKLTQSSADYNNNTIYKFKLLPKPQELDKNACNRDGKEFKFLTLLRVPSKFFVI